MIVGIYKIESPSGNFYIGSSVNVRKRMLGHKRELAKGTHINTALQNASNKYGVESFVFSHIASPINKDDLRVVEQQFIDVLKPQYNISTNADCALFDSVVIKNRILSVSKPVIRLTDGFRFDSGYEAAREAGEKSADNISTAIKNGWKFAGHFWKYEGQDTTLEDTEENWWKRDALRKKSASCGAAISRSKQVRRLIDGSIFISATAASVFYNCHKKTVSESISLGVVRAGSRWEYV